MFMKLPALLTVLATVSAPALDLTPNFINTHADGVIIRRPYFSDGARKYALTLDSETELSPYQDGALFKFAKFTQAQMRLRPSPFSSDLKFAPETLERYEQAARKLLPQVAEKIKLIGDFKNPWPINGWQSHRFLYHYVTASGEASESITFLNITAEQQVIVQAFAPAKEFPEVAGRADDIIRRWHRLNPDAIVGGN